MRGSHHVHPKNTLPRSSRNGKESGNVIRSEELSNQAALVVGGVAHQCSAARPCVPPPPRAYHTGPRQISARDAEAAVLTALREGRAYRHLSLAGDMLCFTMCSLWDAFHLPPQFMQGAVRASGLARESVFVTTKLWNADNGYDATLQAFHRSLSELGLDYGGLEYGLWWMGGTMVDGRDYGGWEGLWWVGLWWAGPWWVGLWWVGLWWMGGTMVGGRDYGGWDYGGGIMVGTMVDGRDYGGWDYGEWDYGGRDYGGWDYGGWDYGGWDYGGWDYVDLYVLHSPMRVDARLDSWRAMEDLLRGGRVRAIGVSNFGQHQLEELFEHCTVRPAVNQLELHPFGTRRALVDFCVQHGMALQAYSPLTKGTRLRDPTLVEPMVPSCCPLGVSTPRVSGMGGQMAAPGIRRALRSSWCAGCLQSGFHRAAHRSVNPAHIAANTQVPPTPRCCQHPGVAKSQVLPTPRCLNTQCCQHPGAANSQVLPTPRCRQLQGAANTQALCIAAVLYRIPLSFLVPLLAHTFRLLLLPDATHVPVCSAIAHIILY
ncbi:unnamed protein product [Closterium sp. NIES-65]|nr:unnamed protein product [Closterium sp. NIES-65]